MHWVIIAQDASNGLGEGYRDWANLTAVGAVIVALFLLILYLPRLHKEQREERNDFRAERERQQTAFLTALDSQRTDFRDELSEHRQQSQKMATEGHDLVRQLVDHRAA